MAINGEIRLDWENGTDKFNVAIIGLMLDLEEKCGNVGLFEIADRLESSMIAGAQGRIAGRARVNDIRETIRIGLIGGGKSADQAAKIVRTHVDTRPLYQSVLLAYSIVAAAIRGDQVQGDEVGKKDQADRAADGDSLMTRDASSDPQSTDSLPG